MQKIATAVEWIKVKKESNSQCVVLFKHDALNEQSIRTYESMMQAEYADILEEMPVYVIVVGEADGIISMIASEMGCKPENIQIIVLWKEKPKHLFLYNEVDPGLLILACQS